MQKHLLAFIVNAFGPYNYVYAHYHQIVVFIICLFLFFILFFLLLSFTVSKILSTIIHFLLIKRYNLYKVLACSTTFFQLSPFCVTFFKLLMFIIHFHSSNYIWSLSPFRTVLKIRVSSVNIPKFSVFI